MRKRGKVILVLLEIKYRTRSFVGVNEVRLRLLFGYLAFRFCIPTGNVFQIIITWILLLSEKK